MAKNERVTIDFTTIDRSSDEFVMYLVEEGPWAESGLAERLRAIQTRVYNAVDVAIDGYLAGVHPESRGGKVRIQVDLHDKPPEVVEALVRKLADHIADSEEYRRDIEASENIAGLRILAKKL
jgi:hypothetical protein